MPRDAVTEDNQGETHELPLDENFIEQAEYIHEASFDDLNAEHPEEASILRRLSVGGAKLLVGPRGCGKSTLLLKAYYGLLRDPAANTLPVYVNFKLSLKLEPMYAKTANASFWFGQWLVLKILEGVDKALADSGRYKKPADLPTRDQLQEALLALESGNAPSDDFSEAYTIERLASRVSATLKANKLTRCVLLLDDAAHAFSPQQQEDFFEFFREIKSREISPKAAIYPGITTHSPTFHVGHDAEQIDVWVRPDSESYLEFMRTLARRRFKGTLPAVLASDTETLDFLAYASFGVPRSFLNMLRTIYHASATDELNPRQVTRAQILEMARSSPELAHGVYDSLAKKLPSYRTFVHTGRAVYQTLIESVKNFNQGKEDDKQALEFGLKKPIPNEIEKILSFYQYAGLVMPAGENSRGVKGTFELYMIHYGDLAAQNAIIGRRGKSITSFVAAFKSRTHQAWPRITPETLVASDSYELSFRLSLANCQACGAERANETAKFCQNCGSQLKLSSIYDQLVSSDISSLPLSAKMVARIKGASSIRTIKDILMDGDRSKLRAIPYVGPIRSEQIVNYAEEYLA